MPSPNNSDKSGKSSWFDEQSNTPLIHEQAKRLTSFVDAIADGKVTDDEVAAQEARLIKIMKEIEPQLDPKLHAKVTELLCEITAYDMMQALNLMQQSRPATSFRG
jgi:hypothetical protein